MTLAFLLAALLALRLAAARPHLVAVLALPALLACAHSGLTFPDIDQPLPLDHRSALTHGVGPALALALVPWARAAAAGLAIGTGFHLAADLFPDAMVGYATVALPLAGRLSAAGSYAWLLTNALACGLVGSLLLLRTVENSGLRAVAAAGVALLGLSYLFRVDGGWPVLAILLGLGWAALRVPGIFGKGRA